MSEDRVTIHIVGEDITLHHYQWEHLRNMLAPGVYSGSDSPEDQQIRTYLDQEDARSLAERITDKLQ